MNEKTEMIKEEDKIEFTGERFVPQEISGEIEVEHFHRYLTVADLARGKVVLDAASGAGYGSYFISRTAERVYGIDISPEAISYSQKKYVSDNLAFKQSSIEKLDFPDNYFDVVISFETIEHVDAEIQNLFLSEVRRVLKAEGILVISTPNKELYSDRLNYKNEFHVKEFYRDEFIQFLKGYFSEVQICHQYITGASVILSDLPETVKALNFDKEIDGKYFIAMASNRKISRSEQIDSVYEYEQEKESFATLFYYNGENYDYQNFTRRSFPFVNEDAIIDLSFDIEFETNKLRFDPIEGTPCKISILEISAEKDNVKCRPFNAASRESSEETVYDVFLNDDPMYEIYGLFRKGDSLKLRLKIKTLDSSETYFNLNRTIDSQNVCIDILKDQTDQLNNTVNSLNEEITKLKSSYNFEIAKSNLVIQTLSQDLAEARSNLQSAIVNLEGANSELSERQKNIEILTEYINGLQSSASWKITKPLRNLRGIMKRKNREKS